MASRSAQQRDWSQPQHVGSGYVRVVQSAGSWYVEVDGVLRSAKSTEARARAAAAQVFAALIPDGCCPVCARRIGSDLRGRVAGHSQPTVWGALSRPCPGSGLLSTGGAQ